LSRKRGPWGFSSAVIVRARRGPSQQKRGPSPIFATCYTNGRGR
jgi:hypothetical protein